MELKQKYLGRFLGLPSLNSAGVHRLFGMAGSLYDCLSYIELH